MRLISLLEELLASLRASLDDISSALLPVHSRLVEIKQELDRLIARKSPHAFSLSEVQVLQDEIREIDSARIDGKYMTKNGDVVPGQAAVIALLESCFDDIHELLSSREAVGGENPLRSVYEDLIEIRAQLEYKLHTAKWAIQTGDLNMLQRRLGDIDNRRVDGKFLDEEGGCPPGQAVLHFLLHKCYRLVYKLQVTSEPVQDSLMPIFNQLYTLQKCLNELAKWNMELTAQELLPYQMKLSGIDALRVDGKFVDDGGQVPQGQAILHEMLQECYESLRNLQTNEQ